MTALTTLVRPARAEHGASPPPLPWRRMAWVTWRQHRVALTGTAGALGVIAAGLWIAGLQLHHAYAAALACHPAGSFACSEALNAFNGRFDFLANGFLLQIVPPLIGAFVGGPVLAREMESGTFRFAWTQGLGRWRWTLSKLVALGVVVTAATGALSVLTSWYYQPYFPAGGAAASLSKDGPIGASLFAPGLFDLRGVTFAAWTLAAFAIGVLAGILIRRVVPAILATLVAYTGLAFAAGGFLREHYMSPLVTSASNLPATAWVLSQQWVRGGRPVSQQVIDQVLAQGGAQVVGKGGVPKSTATTQFLAHHGFTQLTTYQPAARFWPFQWIEGGWLFLLAVLLIGAALWLVRRRAT